ncbi:MAG: HyaD/HybD family hydrogenase maturation endopeptidase [Thermodesulfovibrionales bacterium]|nr:HyaD/HybD family hydrogenase maturation endopeptidase [Thermodesulfovibrionales bacterium]
MKILVLGLGNILLSDEGIGVRVVEELRERYTFFPDIEIVDGGTKGLDLLPLFESREKVLIVDAVDFGREPGYIGILEKSEIPTILHSKLSVHHIGLGEVLLAAQMLGIMPEEICLIGIQPYTLETGLELSSTIASKKEELLRSIVDKLRLWGVETRETGIDVSCSSVKDNS